MYNYYIQYEHYINLPQYLKHCKSILYTDDTSLYYITKEEIELPVKIHQDLIH